MDDVTRRALSGRLRALDDRLRVLETTRNSVARELAAEENDQALRIAGIRARLEKTKENIRRVTGEREEVFAKLGGGGAA